ncbi:MAG: enoyl-CoA hydratase/isomerase family protein [Pseudolysinimonas sp.]
MTPPALTIERRDGVMRVVIAHPPMNVLDATVRAELDELSHELSSDAETRVVVIESADPEYFIAHADVHALRGRHADPRVRKSALGPFHAMVERWRTLPQPTIALVRGAARGGGLEFLLSLDMVYASQERAVFGLPEVALGILPAGGGTQRLARTTSRGRAMEVILACEDLSADEAEGYGLVTRSLPEAELAAHVDRIAERIASWPVHAVRLAKCAVDAAAPSPVDGLLDEYHLFSLLLSDQSTDDRLKRFLAAGGQTPEGERRLGARLPHMFGTPGEGTLP